MSGGFPHASADGSFGIRRGMADFLSVAVLQMGAGVLPRLGTLLLAELRGRGLLPRVDLVRGREEGSYIHRVSDASTRQADRGGIT